MHQHGAKSDAKRKNDNNGNGLWSASLANRAPSEMLEGFRDSHHLGRQYRQTYQAAANDRVNSKECIFVVSINLLHSHLGISDEYLPWHAGKWHIHLTITGRCDWVELVVERIVGCLERRANVGRSLLEDSPFDHCPVDRPCRPAGRGTDWELGHLRERSR